jgi:energy-coupling factor transporter ATP-binding protein EcfA2
MQPLSQPQVDLTTIPLLRDDPLFGAGTTVNEKDAFDHKSYARALLDAIERNPSPLTIGLFGPWGIGKSTIVNLLLGLVPDSIKPLRPVVFNAWKYSSDSFRRQFLIEVASQLHTDKTSRDKAVKRLRRLSHADVIRPRTRQSLVERLTSIGAISLHWHDKGIALVAIATLLVVSGAIMSWATDNSLWSIGAATLLPFVLSRRLEDYVLIEERPLSDPQLIFPEQFAEEFCRLVDSTGPLEEHKALIVIDDLDRCEAGTIRDILVTIKSFLGHPNCYFLIPCDEASILRIFSGESSLGGYSEEHLRKYFTLCIRMSPIRGADLVDLANSVAGQTSIPASVVQVALLGNCRDARKMKHFLNTFLLKYAVAQHRAKAGMLPIDIDESIEALAKAALIEETCPAAFAQIIQQPSLYDALNRIALGEPAELLTAYGLEGDPQERFPGLLDVLKLTEDIRILHVDAVFSLKTTNVEASIPAGFELANAIATGDTNRVGELLLEIKTSEHKRSLSGLLISQLSKATDRFLKNTVTATLTIYSGDQFLLPEDRRAVAVATTKVVNDNSSLSVLDLSPEALIACGASAGNWYLQPLLDRYLKEMANRGSPAGLANAVTALSAHSLASDRLIQLLNEKTPGWMINSESATLSFITDLTLPPAFDYPSKKLLRAVISQLLSEPSETDQTVDLNRRDLISRYWNSDLTVPLAERLSAIVPTLSPPGKHVAEVEFVLDTILQFPQIVRGTPTLVQQQFNALKDMHSQILSHKQKIKALQVILLMALWKPSASPSDEARAYATSEFPTLV